MTYNQHRPGLTRLGVVGLLLVVIASLLAGCAPASPPTATTGPTTSLPSSPIQSNPDGQFAVLLLGYGGPGHDGPYLTDSMMVVIVNPAKKSLTLLSLPRDSWVPLSFTGSKPDSYDKLNTAYAYAHDAGCTPAMSIATRGRTAPATWRRTPFLRSWAPDRLLPRDRFPGLQERD